MKKTKIKLGKKTYKVLVAETPEEKEIGLSKTSNLPEDCGMLFEYPEPQKELYFTMEDTSIDLDIIYLDSEGEVISVFPTKAHDPEPVMEENAQFVLEVNINSGIKEGDELREVDEEDEDYTEEEKEELGRMLMLDSNGNVQMKLQGGERIVSMIETRKLVKSALKAYHSDEDSDYKKVGKLIFKILDGQDSRDAEYTSLPD